MAGYRKGYSSYRGRGSKGKFFLSLFLVLVIIVSVGFLALQRLIVYDETGTPHFLLPSQSQEEAPPPPPAGSLIVESVEEVVEEVKTVVYLPPEPVVTPEDAAAALSAAAGYDGVALTVKPASGRVYFPSATAVSSGMEEGTAEALATVLSGSGYTAARLSCFADPKAANGDVEGKGLKNTGGYIFYDGENHQWLDPGKADARAYLIALITECAALGFDEIILTDVGYPTVGKLHKIAYNTDDLDGTLEAFLRQVTAALEPYGTTLTLQLTAGGMLLGQESGGLTLETAARYASRICAVTTAEEAENLETILGRYGTGAEFVPMLESLPFGYDNSAILLAP